MKWYALAIFALLFGMTSAHAVEYQCKEGASCTITPAASADGAATPPSIASPPPAMMPPVAGMMPGQPGMMPPAGMMPDQPGMMAPPPGMMPPPPGAFDPRAQHKAFMERQDKLMDEAEANNKRFDKILSRWEHQQAEYQRYLDSLKDNTKQHDK